MIDLLLAALLSQSGKPSDPDAVAMWIDDLGRSSAIPTATQDGRS
jgi:hypothetical protein